MPEIVIRMDDSDFEHLYFTSMEWRHENGRNDWTEQADRFELHGSDTEIDWSFRYAFWVGEEWANVMFARAYLESAGQEYQILWDMVENPDPSWVILSNYISPVWLRAKQSRNG